MNNYKLVRKSDLAVVCSYSSSSPKVMGGAWGDTKMYLTMQVPDGLDPDCVLCIHNSKGELFLVQNSDLENAKQASLLAKAWSDLRLQRNSLLAACDYTQLADCPLADDKKASYRTYRQALRDLPAHTSDPANPSWPSKP